MLYDRINRTTERVQLSRVLFADVIFCFLCFRHLFYYLLRLSEEVWWFHSTCFLAFSCLTVAHEMQKLILKVQSESDMKTKILSCFESKTMNYKFHWTIKLLNSKTSSDIAPRWIHRYKQAEKLATKLTRTKYGSANILDDVRLNSNRRFTLYRFVNNKTRHSNMIELTSDLRYFSVPRAILLSFSQFNTHNTFFLWWKKNDFQAFEAHNNGPKNRTQIQEIVEQRKVLIQ